MLNMPTLTQWKTDLIITLTFTMVIASVTVHLVWYCREFSCSGQLDQHQLVVNCLLYPVVELCLSAWALFSRSRLSIVRLVISGFCLVAAISLVVDVTILPGWASVVSITAPVVCSVLLCWLLQSPPPDNQNGMEEDLKLIDIDRSVHPCDDCGRATKNGANVCAMCQNKAVFQVSGGLHNDDVIDMVEEDDALSSDGT